LGTPIRFTRIQGADCCGVIVAAGAGVSLERIGQRVLVRPLQTTGAAGDPFATWTFGSECDGAFAEYTKTFAEDALPVSSRWTDMELASIPCAYSTAEGMLQRARVGAERVLVTGASGGVGSAAIQLAKRRGARVAALTSADKTGDVMALGADETIDRDGVLDAGAFDVVVDLVAGPRWPEIVGALRRGGRYVTAGAIEDDHCVLIHSHRTSRTRERLFTDMTVQQHTAIQQLPVLAQDIPPIGILLTPRIGAGYLHAELIAIRLARHLDVDHIRKNSLRRRSGRRPGWLGRRQGGNWRLYGGLIVHRWGSRSRLRFSGR
jgi:NADPH:quinone reductase-like Zn-dependent oxidoreductase